MTKKSPITVDIYGHLLELIQKELVLTQKYRSVSQIIHEESVIFLNRSDSDLPYNPFRFSGSRMMQMLCDEYYPRKRTVISVDKGLFTLYKEALFIRASILFPQNIEQPTITNRFAAECTLWSSALSNNLHLNDTYFNDLYLLEKLDIHKMIVSSLLKVAAELGRSPTAREYEEIRNRVSGPSLSFIKRNCGTFNNAKSLAGLDREEMGM